MRAESQPVVSHKERFFCCLFVYLLFELPAQTNSCMYGDATSGVRFVQCLKTLTVVTTFGVSSGPCNDQSEHVRVTLFK